MFISWNALRLTAKENVILLKNDKVIDFFNMTTYRFFSIKNVQATTPIQ